MLFTLLFLLAVVGQSGGQTVPGAGSLVGCASDQAGGRLPGVSIVASVRSTRRITQGNAAGCYELRGLEPGTYRVTAQLGGFDHVTRDDVLISTATAARFDVSMRISSICECVRIGTTTLLDHWRRADQVLHVRIVGPAPRQSAPAGLYTHVATVLDVLKPSAMRPAETIPLVQNQRGGAPGPYDPGEELVVFLKSFENAAFWVMNDEPGLMSGKGYPAMAFKIRDGRVRSGPPEFSRFEGRAVERLLKQLRGLSRLR
jgi:hypothetical protein